MDTHIHGEPDDGRVEAAAATLRLLADPTRLRVLWALRHGEHSVGPLAVHVGTPAAALSQHLAKLRLAGLVSARRDGNRMYYTCESDHVGRLVEAALFPPDDVVRASA